MTAGLSPLATVPRPAENGEQEAMAPVQWHDATVGGPDTTGLSLDLPCTQDPELFFAESPQDVEQAKALCRGCRATSTLERETGIEPATNSLEGCDSTTELLPPAHFVSW